MINLKINTNKKAFLTIYVFFVIITLGFILYIDYIVGAPLSFGPVLTLSIIALPPVMAGPFHSKIFSIYWKISGVLCYLISLSCYYLSQNNKIFFEIDGVISYVFQNEFYYYLELFTLLIPLIFIGVFYFYLKKIEKIFGQEY